MPRVVRLGRAANDNARLAWRARLVLIGAAVAVLAVAVGEWAFR